SSVLGSLLAVAAGFLIKPDTTLSLAALGLEGGIRGWRLGFVLGGVPAFLIIWIRLSLREPTQARPSRPQGASATGRSEGLAALFQQPLLARTVAGLGLATVGLATFWGVYIYGKDLLRGTKEREYLIQARAASPDVTDRAQLLKPFEHSIKNWEMT